MFVLNLYIDLDDDFIGSVYSSSMSFRTREKAIKYIENHLDSIIKRNDRIDLTKKGIFNMIHSVKMQLPYSPDNLSWHCGNYELNYVIQQDDIDRCDECGAELTQCGELNEDGPTWDCKVCQLRSELKDLAEELVEHLEQLIENALLTCQPYDQESERIQELKEKYIK